MLLAEQLQQIILAVVIRMLLIQGIMYDRGGLIVWGFANQLDAHQEYVGGLEENATGLPLSGFQLHRAWVGDLQ